MESGVDVCIARVRVFLTKCMFMWECLVSIN